MTYAYFPIREAVYVNRLIGSVRPGGLLAFQHGVLKRGVECLADRRRLRLRRLARI
jgi:hypothetical protein